MQNKNVVVYTDSTIVLEEKAFFKSLAGGDQFLKLFDLIPEVSFFVKDRGGFFQTLSLNKHEHLRVKSQAPFSPMYSAKPGFPRPSRQKQIPSAGSKKSASINHGLTQEEYSYDLSSIEGARSQNKGVRIYRDPKIVSAVKKAESYTCQACGFFFEKQIVHVHQIDPLSEREKPSESKASDLIMLCPCCHYIDHYLLRKKR